ncbi:HAD hydrolase-like protein [Bacillus sp. SB49]|uniref:HAD family hydrolase n=1 Tax=Bacillus sp. SB49 TaxID=1071080 RepID=UPI000408476C|nr:HAD family hydrolase [Bacillus sp. SB49]QHT46238.1 HAD hydrolase-like protein [Bacillus sp. SB49]
MEKSVIFDMDGTLFQTNLVLESALDDAFDYLRNSGKWEGQTPIELYREIMGVPLPEVWKALMPDHSEEDRRLTDAFFLARLLHHIKEGNGALYPHAGETLRLLKEKGCRLFIASNGLIDYLQAIVRCYSLDEWVTETFSIEQIDSLDKADLVKEIVNKYDLKDAVVVGDRLSDIRAAETNGLVSVGCRFDFAKEEELAEADYIINELQDLLPVVMQTVSVE